MCAGAAWAAQVAGSCSAPPTSKAGATGSLYNVAVDLRLNHTSEVRPGVRADECAALLTDFFATGLSRGEPRLPCEAEGCRSGRTGRSRKPLWPSGHRGFKSHTLRHRNPCSAGVYENGSVTADIGAARAAFARRDWSTARAVFAALAAAASRPRTSSCSPWPPTSSGATRRAPAPGRPRTAPGWSGGRRRPGGPVLRAGCRSPTCCGARSRSATAGWRGRSG